MRKNNPLFMALIEYKTLETALTAVFLRLHLPPDNAEEWLINLQNHLIWDSYVPGEDPDADTVVMAAISSVLERHGAQASDAGPEVQQIYTALKEGGEACGYAN